MPITFKVSDVSPPSNDPNNPNNNNSIDMKEYISTLSVTLDNKGKVLLATQKPNIVKPALCNGFVGAAYNAYSSHYKLVFTPDTVWIAITTALALFIDKNAEELRSIFVDHTGKKELKVVGYGCIITANYAGLMNAMAEEIEKNSKPNIRKWLESDFSTTDQESRLVSQLVMMGALKHYFSYSCYLTCGLPEVTLEGTKEDYQNIRERIQFIRTFNRDKKPMMDQGEYVHMNVLCDGCGEHHIHGNRYKCQTCNYDLCHACHNNKQKRTTINKPDHRSFHNFDTIAVPEMIGLSDWVTILEHILDHFIAAFDGKVDTDFWNRIATQTGGGSGPSYLEGWILAFIPFSNQGGYILKHSSTALSSHYYGRVETGDVPTSAVEIPVKIDDNGKIYDTIFYAGIISYTRTTDTIKPCLDWALIEKGK